MKLNVFAMIAAATIGTPVVAQTTVQPAPAGSVSGGQAIPGATVYGPQGQVVGTVTQVAGGVAIVNTGSHKVPFPLTAFTPGASGPTITVTQAQLDELVAQQHAAGAARRDAALVVGASVATADNQPLGTIEVVGGDSVVVLRGPARRLALLRQYFVADGAGLKTRLTLQDIDAGEARAAGAVGAVGSQ